MSADDPVITAHFQALGEQLDRIEVQVKATNGRVTHLEMANVARDAAEKAKAEAIEAMRVERAGQVTRQIRKEDHRRDTKTLLVGVAGVACTIAALIFG
jgi:hypothetical protein